MRRLSILALSLAAGPAFAATIAPVSYDMINGGGRASGGGRNYWDATYTGSGSTTTDGAYLEGGLGKLTDGVVATSMYLNTVNDAGTGDHVGWNYGFEGNPIITFHFDGAPTIRSIAIQVDNSGVGGVYGPTAIYVDGVSRSFTNPTDFGTITLSEFALTGPTHTISFFQTPATWLFVSEISFDDAAPAAVPEPASWTLMLAGFGAIGVGLRRRVRGIAVRA